MARHFLAPTRQPANSAALVDRLGRRARPGGDRARHRIGVVVGTRPEALKLAPVIRALRRHPDQFETIVIATAQHREMLDQALEIVGIRPDMDLDLMRPNQNLAALTGAAVERLTAMLGAARFDLLVAQGDTTTAFAGALAAFYAHVPVAHVEAGLRSGDLANPYPEEANRRLTAVVTTLHFAPTTLARRRLRQEGVPSARIAVTGNTIVDTLVDLLDAPRPPRSSLPDDIALDGRRLIVVTSHRRESWGHDLESVCLALGDLVRRFEDIVIVYPVHMNPNVRETAHRVLRGVPRIHLLPPLDYVGFVDLMRRAYLIVTDSGGVQEEGPTLGKPLLVLRKVTERPEAFDAGVAKLVGTDRRTVVEEVARLLTDASAYRRMSAGANPYGDGRAAPRIVAALTRWFSGKRPLLRPQDEFRPERVVA